MAFVPTYLGRGMSIFRKINIMDHHHGLQRINRRFLSTRTSSILDQQPQPPRRSNVRSTETPPPPPGTGLFKNFTNFKVTEESSKAFFTKWKWLFDHIGVENEENRLYHESNALYHSSVYQSANPEFYTLLGLECDFRGQQALLVLHVWLVHKRLLEEGTLGKILQEQLFDRMWEDAIVRLRHQQVSELTVNKYLKEVQQFGFSACIAYDDCLNTSTTKPGTKKQLPGLQFPLFCHVLNIENPHSSSVSPSKRKAVEKLEKYTFQQMNMLKQVSLVDLRRGAIPWKRLSSSNRIPKNKTLKSSPPVKTGEISTPAAAEPIVGELVSHQWRAALDLRGQMYYWNMENRYSTWDLSEVTSSKAGLND